MFFSQNVSKEEIEGPFARGLKNIGNTCFLNSVLQAMSSCPPFVRYLCELDPQRDIPFTLGLKNCLRALRVKADTSYLTSWRESAATKPFDTSSIFDMIVAHNSNFNGHDQQDAQELLQTVFAMLAKDSEKRRKIRPVNKPPSLANISVENISRSTPVDNPFKGWITSDLVCQSCKKHRPLKHQVFTDISLPFESLGIAMKKSVNFISSTCNNGSYKPGVISLESGPLIGGLPNSNNSAQSSRFHNILTGPCLNLRDCLSDFMKEEELQQDVECQSCSWAETLKAFERKSTSASVGEGATFSGQHDEDRLNKIILQQFKTAMPEGKSDSCSLDLDDVLFSTDIDVDDASSVTDSISLPVSVRSNQSLYATWRTRNGLGLASLPHDRTMKLDPYLVQKVRTRTRKQLILSRPPLLLCLHICRRVADAVTGRMKKLNHHVSFPGVLDLGDYVNSHNTNRTDGQYSSQKGPVDFQTIRANVGPRSVFGFGSGSVSARSANEYLLRSVIVHTGSSEAGHYSAYCLMNDPPSAKTWMYFSDEQVCAVREEEVLKSQAYMLFYERSAAYFKS